MTKTDKTASEIAQGGYATYKNTQGIYIHYDRHNFFKHANISRVQDLGQTEREELYKQQKQTAISNYNAMVPPGFTFDEYQEVMNSTSEVIEGLITEQGQHQVISELKSTLTKRKDMGLQAFTKSKKTKEYSAALRSLVSDVDKLDKVLKKARVLMDAYAKVDATTLDLKTKQTGQSIPVNPNELYILHDEQSALTSYKNISKNLDELERIIKAAQTAGSKAVLPGSGSTTDDIVAMEIVRGFAGQLNNIQGLGYEVILGALLDEDNVEEALRKELINKLKASGVEIVDVDMSKGQQRVDDIYKTRKTTDVGFTIQVDRENMSGLFEMNLSAKSMPKLNEKGLSKAVTTYKSGRPWGRIGEELNLLNKEFEYYFANLSVKPTARAKSAGALKDGKTAYGALKNYIGAAYALKAIGGTGIGDDMVTHVVYLNKVMTVMEVLDSLNNKNTQLAVSTGAAINQEPYFVEGDDTMTARWARSKKVLDEVRKITFRFSK